MSGKRKIVCPGCNAGMSFDTDAQEIECPVCLRKVKIEAETPKETTHLEVNASIGGNASDKTQAKPNVPPVSSREITPPPVILKKTDEKNTRKPLVITLVASSSFFLLIILILVVKLARSGSPTPPPPPAASPVLQNQNPPSVVPPSESPENKGSVQEKGSPAGDEKKDPATTVTTEKIEVEPIQIKLPMPAKKDSPGQGVSKADDAKSDSKPKTDDKDDSALKPAGAGGEGKEQSEKDGQSSEDEIKDEDLRKKIIEVCRYTSPELERSKTVSIQDVNNEIEKRFSEVLQEKFPDSKLQNVKKEADNKYSTADVEPPEKKFTNEMLESLRKEVEEKYVLIKVGDNISFESGSKKYAGIYQGYVGKDKISLSFKHIPESELPADIMARLSKTGVEKAKEKHLNMKYFVPKSKYETQYSKILEEAEKNRKKYITDNFYSPRLAFMKTEKERISNDCFRHYGFRLNDWTGSWEKKDEFVENTLATIKKSLSDIVELKVSKAIYESRCQDYAKTVSQLDNDLKVIKESIKDFTPFQFRGYLIGKVGENVYEVAERVRGDWDDYPSSNHTFLITVGELNTNYYDNSFSMKVMKCQIKDKSKKYLKVYEGLLNADNYYTLEASVKDTRDELVAMRKEADEINGKIERMNRLFDKYGVSR